LQHDDELQPHIDVDKMDVNLKLIEDDDYDEVDDYVDFDEILQD
jgi:hypothetical protein